MNKRSARRTDLYLTTHNTNNRQISISPSGFEPAIPASEWPQTHALDCAATGICLVKREKQHTFLILSSAVSAYGKSSRVTQYLE